MGRIIIFTGKGGVGKTSVAAAHAVRSAREGRKTLLVSTDMAHNLGDVFLTEVGSRETRVRDNLYLLELDPDLLMRQEFPNVSEALGSMLGSAGYLAENLDGDTFIPGMEDLFSLLKIAAIYESGVYDRILVDCAPTGETLSLLKLPELLAWYMEKFFPVGKMIVRVMAPLSQIKYHVTLPDRKAMNEVEALHGKLMGLQALLKDDTVCSVRLVCIPEKMVVEETKRSFMYLNLYGYQVDGVFINRILPANPGNAFLEHWREIQQVYLENLERVFVGLPMTRIPWYPQEVCGEEAIDRLSHEVFDAADLFEVRFRAENETYEAVEGGYCLTLRLPGAVEKDLSVVCHGTDLDIRLKQFTRCIPLPNTLRGASVTDVELRDGLLRVRFRLKDAGEGESGKEDKAP